MGEARQFDAVDVVEAGDALAASGPMRRTHPATMTHAQRLALVAEVEAGDVFALRFRARCFGSGENLNHATLSPDQIRELAAGAQGADLMVEHSGGVGGVVGEVLSGEAVDESGGGCALILDHEITDPPTMIRFIRRQLRRFSVSIMAADWLGAGKDILAISPVRLSHNAFVSTPAFEGTEVVHSVNKNNKVRDNMEPEVKPDERVAELEAKVAELEAVILAQSAEIEDLKKQLDTQEEAAFSAILDRAQEGGKITPASRQHFQSARKAMGFSAASALVGGLAEGKALAIKPAGVTAATPASEFATKQERIAAEVQRLTGGGNAKKKTRI